MADTNTSAEPFSEEMEDILRRLDGQNNTTRISIALFTIAGLQAYRKKLTDEQFYDLFMAGMQAHRLASSEAFLTLFFKDDEAISRMRKSGGLSASTLALMLLKMSDERVKSAKRFSTLMEMLKGDSK